MTDENSRPCQGAADANGDADNTTVGRSTDKISSSTDGSSAAIAPYHRLALEKAAIPIELALECGVYSAVSRLELPQNLHNYAGALPGLVFPWRAPDGHVEYQLRPDVPAGPDGDGKYLQPAKVRLLNVLPGSEPPIRVLMVEGTKQCLAARANARPDELVIGIPGCNNAMKDGQLLPGLDDLVDGMPVVLFFDSDIAINPQVRLSAIALREALILEGASSCAFAKVPGTGKEGLDDFLGGRALAKRPKLLARLVDQAKTDMPRQVRQAPDAVLGRPTVDVSDDRLVVISETLRYTLDRYDGERLFNHGGVISELTGKRMKPVDKDRFPNYLAEAIYFYTVDATGQRKPAWPDTRVMGAVWSAADAFTPLEQLITTPFMRPDGSICQQSGYDASTKSLLQLDPDLQDVRVPDAPSDEDVANATALLLDDWFGDMPLHEPADRANLLALILTPFIRRLVPLAPMAVIDGLMMGVGKNLLADCLAIVVTGANVDPLPYAGNDDELRKMITAHYGTGASMFVFDEAHVLQGASLARALTAVEYTDRILGHTRMGRYTNLATWIALGNQVQVRGDIIRRVYRIALRPAGADPEQRQTATFQHADLRLWTRKNRARLIEAILTLIRAWFNAGQPVAPATIGFGSFEEWQRIAGGIVAHAGVPDFLANTLAWRSESDFENGYWQDHLNDVEQQFPAGTRFTIKKVVEAMKDREITEFPPGLYGHEANGYPRQLGVAYYRVKDRWFGDIRLVRDGGPGSNGATGRVSAWRLERKPNPPQSGTSEGPEGSEGSEGPPSPRMGSALLPPKAPAHSARPSATAERGPTPHPSGPSAPSGPHAHALALDDPGRADARLRRARQLSVGMTSRGLRIDQVRLDQAGTAARQRQQALLLRLVAHYGFPGTRADGAPASTPWATTGGSKHLARLAAGSAWPSTDGKAVVTKEALQQAVLDVDDPDLVELAEILLELQPDHFLFGCQQHSRDGRIHPVYADDTVTGRWTSSQPNVYGAGRRTPALLAQRAVVLAEPGEVFIGLDLDGIDARVVAGLSGDKEYAALMKPGVDVHAEVSQMFFGTRSRRSEAKKITHGLAYGRSAGSIAAQLGLPLSIVEPMVNRFHARFPGIRQWQDAVRTQAHHGPVPTGTGRTVQVDSDNAWTKGPGRVAQATAHDLATEGLLRIADAGYEQCISLFLHDEVLLSVPAEAADTILTEVTALMSFDWQAPSGLIIPITASPHAASGHRWSDLYGDIRSSPGLES